MRDYYNLVFLKEPTNIGKNTLHISNVDRWMLYFSWTESIKQSLKENISALQVRTIKRSEGII